MIREASTARRAKNQATCHKSKKNKEGEDGEDGEEDEGGRGRRGPARAWKT